MAAETMDDQYSIKNLLFYRAIPNYVIPVSTDGYKIYACNDCGDRFVFQSSYEQHVNRKSVKITYTCRHCNHVKIFFNRCNLLAHIRSHTFKTATINVSDLMIEPLPQCHFRFDPSNVSNQVNLPQPSQSEKGNKKYNDLCFECKSDISDTGVMYKDRGKHYMQLTNQIYTCPVCLFAMPTICGLKAHLRIHLKSAPYYCPECGIYLSKKAIHYPYNHDCDGFKMMRATARYKCSIPGCHLFHPNEFKDHMKNHLKKVYKCQFCVVACFNEHTIRKHLKTHSSESKALIFYQCEMCPGRLVLHNQMENHLKSHVNSTLFPCWGCGATFNDVPLLLEHHINTHNPNEDIKTVYSSFITNKPETNKKRIYRVVKKCSKCKRSFTYKCKYNEIQVLPNECPYKCSLQSVDVQANTNSNRDAGAEIKCHICGNKIFENWEEIKKHYASNHKEHQCVDIKVVLTRFKKNVITKNKQQKHVITSMKNKRSKKMGRITKSKRKIFIKTSSDTSGTTLRNTLYTCSKCDCVCENKQSFETHIVTHRDPCMAYQCMECGQCFVVKPSFSTHLIVEHGILNVEEYITQKQCYNENALEKYQSDSAPVEPLRNNQCKICRDQFDNSDDLEKHFRVHGMAFLLQNTNKNNTNT
ncbi:zinc finger protein 532-like [Galleria mellonella]|uniref:Zinc finger protein 532-like n=1 Tax=Galleria mellonella TaxID=7137 RepID=A0A6J1WSR7_GALME|nr:zinc finger protein 532-like [Galleria mellonella]